MSRAGLPQRLLYRTRTGAVLLRLLTAPRLSKWAGRFCDSPLSKGLIRPFARRNRIDVGACRRRAFWSFNDFFTRQLQPGARPFAQTPGCLQSPADGCVSAYRIDPSSRFCIKRIEYSLEALLRDPALARRYEGGTCCILRLAPAHYHRFAYVDGGVKGKNVRIEGRLHTVRPIAYERHAVPVENTREYCVICTEQFGQVVQM